MTTIIERKKRRMQDAVLDAMETLEITREEYNQLKFDLAFKWFASHDAQHWADSFKKTKAFWGWWDTIYYLNDRRFNNLIWLEEHNYTLEDKHLTYESAHTDDSPFYPNKSTLAAIRRELKTIKKQSYEPQL